MATLVIEVTPELESRLQEEAERRGLPLPECARELLQGVLKQQDEPEPARPTTPAERAAFLAALQARLAHVQTSSEEFARRKQEEIDFEEHHAEDTHS